MRPLSGVLVVAALSGGCALPRRAAELPKDDGRWIAVLSGEMPAPIDDVARHAWIVGNVGGESGRLARWEYKGSAYRTSGDSPYSHFGEGDVAVHGIVRGTDEEIARMARCLDAETRTYNERHPSYFPMPGPNSNTFVAEALRACSIRVELPATCIGRDYLGPAGASRTEGGTGVQLESWVAGARVGLKEGVEAHVLSLALGVHFWPPGITAPINPGRVGVDLDMHASQEQTRQNRRDDGDDDDRRWRRGGDSRDEERHRKYGVAAAWLSLRGGAVKRPDDAGGLAQRLTVGLSGRGVYTKRHLGWGFGLDLELGAGFPLGFAYGAYLYPTGIAWSFGPTGYVGVFGGFGASGVSARVPGAFELPVEVRAEVDAGTRARLGVRAAVTWIPDSDARSGRSSLLSWGDELSLSTFARFGRTRRTGSGRFTQGSGRFFGLERREVMGTYWIGVFLGSEVDFGG